MDDWIPLPEAIDRVCMAKATGRTEAVPYVLSRARGAEIGSRIALETHRSRDQPRREVAMKEAHWRDLDDLETDWIETGNAEWTDGYAWRGIEIHAGDLAVHLGTNRRQSDADLQPVAECNSATPTDPNASDQPGTDWIRIGEAIRSLHQLLKETLYGQEPAPWIGAPAGPTKCEDAQATVCHRQMARTSLTMRRALMFGDLTAHLANASESRPLPCWVWENASVSENAFHFSWVPLDPFRSHGLHDQLDWRCYLRRAEFEAWLRSPNIAEVGELPKLPISSASEALPDPITYREPSAKAFVALTEAVTWIAFTLAMSRDEFAIGEQCGFGPFARSDWSLSLREAMASFADHASAGNIRVRGRYVANYADHAAVEHTDTDY